MHSSTRIIPAFTMLLTVFQMVANISNADIVLNQTNSEDVARALLFFDQTKEYQGEYGGIKTNSSWTWGRYTLNTDLQITRLSIESTDIPIPIDKPLKGLPIGYSSPLTHFSTSVVAIDKQGVQKAGGSYSVPILDKNSIISISLIPGNIHRHIDYVVPPGVNTNLLKLEREDGQIVYYDSDTGGFDLWMDPFGHDEQYRIIDGQTGRVLFIGSIGPIQVPNVASNKVLNISNLGNVVDSYYTYNRAPNTWGTYGMLFDQTYDSILTVNRKVIPAKIMIVDFSSESDNYGLMIYISDSSATITAKKWQETGELPILPLLLMERVDDYQILYNTERNLKKLVITVTSPRTNSTFFININPMTE